MYFLLGKGPDNNSTENLTIKKGILEEYQKFDDIVIGNILSIKNQVKNNSGDFYDTYENLPLKTHLGYQFYHDHCENHAGTVQFIDDDTFVLFNEMEKILVDPSQGRLS